MEIKKYLLKRIINIIPILIGISVITFLLMNIIPGDPAELILRASGNQPTKEAVLALREKMGLNGTILHQYICWLKRIIHMDFGVSYTSGQPVFNELIGRFPATIELAVCTTVFVIIISVPMGVMAAVYKNRIIDYICRTSSIIGASMPGFWLGMLLIYLFCVKLRLLPVTGMGGAKHIILPAVTLGFGFSSIYIRVIRSGMIEVLKKDFIKAARVRGLGKTKIIFVHGLKNVLLPTITLFGMNFGSLLGGAAIVETVFSWPGIGKFVVDAIYKKDYMVIQAYVLFMAVVFVTVNLIVDICYALIDPRIRLR